MNPVEPNSGKVNRTSGVSLMRSPDAPPSLTWLCMSAIISVITQVKEEEEKERGSIGIIVLISENKLSTLLLYFWNLSLLVVEASSKFHWGKCRLMLTGLSLGVSSLLDSCPYVSRFNFQEFCPWILKILDFVRLFESMSITWVCGCAVFWSS